MFVYKKSIFHRPYYTTEMQDLSRKFCIIFKFCIGFLVGTLINQRFIEASASGLDMPMSRLRGSSLLVNTSVNNLNVISADLLIATFCK